MSIEPDQNQPLPTCQRFVERFLRVIRENSLLSGLFGYREQVTPPHPNDYLELSHDLQEEPRALVALHSSLLAHYLHQNQLHWSKTQLAAVIQVAGIAGGYSQQGIIGATVMLGTWFLTRNLLAISIRDRECREANLYWFRRLERAILCYKKPSNHSCEPTKEETGVDANWPQNLRLGVPPPGIEAADLFRFTLILLMMSDLVMAAVFLIVRFFEWYCTP